MHELGQKNVARTPHDKQNDLGTDADKVPSLIVTYSSRTSFKDET